MIDPKYTRQVDLLLQTIPFVAKEKLFVQWKLHNINILKNTNKSKFNEMLHQLEKVLGL